MLAALAVVAISMYLGYIRHGGWYLDDWSFYASMQEQRGNGFGGLIDGCRSEITGGRALACLYHASVFGAFGAHQWLYHAWATLMLWGMAALGFAILRRIGVPRSWSLLAMVALILYPSSDATRLWPVAVVGEYVMLLYLGGLYVALVAFERRRRVALALHGTSLLLTVVAVTTYEIVIPLVALNGLVYVAFLFGRGDTGSRRAVFARAAIDFGTAGLVGLLRVRSSSTADVFVIERTSEQSLDRLKLLLNRTWEVWHESYLPGTLGLAVLVAVLAGAMVAWRSASGAQGRRIGWALLGFAMCAAVLGTSAAGYLSANDYYVPDQVSTANRINLPSSVAGAVAFMLVVYLVIAIGEVTRLARLSRLGAAVLVVWVGLHMIDQSRLHQARWIESARQTDAAVAKYPAAVRGVPQGAAVLGFDVPQWEAGWIPVFETTWDLEGAIRWSTTLDPGSARPASSDLQCGVTGVEQAGQVILPYRGLAPIWAVSPRRGISRAVPDRAACRRVFGGWGAVPFWGRTVTQPQLFE